MGADRSGHPDHVHQRRTAETLDQIGQIFGSFRRSLGAAREHALVRRLPDQVTLAITEADPVVKGQTAASSYKPAVLENGIRILVPPFIASGERVIVDTSELTYISRA